jgi:hypothetical protein
MLTEPVQFQKRGSYSEKELRLMLIVFSYGDIIMPPAGLPAFSSDRMFGNPSAFWNILSQRLTGVGKNERSFLAGRQMMTGPATNKEGVATLRPATPS